MKTLVVLLAAAAVMVQSPSLLAQTAPPAGTTDASKNLNEGGETSDRTPGTHSPTPEAQIDTTKQGETSDRTPAKDGDVADPSTTKTGATETAPAGNPFTMEDARKHLMQQGYTNVSELVKDAQGKWVGSATKDGKTVPVAVDLNTGVTTK
jgi:putative membrane protein